MEVAIILKFLTRINLMKWTATPHLTYLAALLAGSCLAQDGVQLYGDTYLDIVQIEGTELLEFTIQ